MQTTRESPEGTSGTPKTPVSLRWTWTSLVLQQFVYDKILYHKRWITRISHFAIRARVGASESIDTYSGLTAGSINTICSMSMLWVSGAYTLYPWKSALATLARADWISKQKSQDIESASKVAFTWRSRPSKIDHSGSGGPFQPPASWRWNFLQASTIPHAINIVSIRAVWHEFCPLDPWIAHILQNHLVI